jgi:small subunit ribosomal protein S4
LTVKKNRKDSSKYLVNPGEEIQMEKSGLEIPDVRELGETKTPVPSWLEKRNGGGVVLQEPNREEIDSNIRERLIVEFYSR